MPVRAKTRLPASAVEPGQTNPLYLDKTTRFFEVSVNSCEFIHLYRVKKGFSVSKKEPPPCRRTVALGAVLTETQRQKKKE